MDILIFDMDGVLLEAKGYHRALQETVRLTGEHLSLSNIQLTQEQIHRFESIGISSEWHSSALCMAFLQIEIQSGVPEPSLALENLFITLQDQSLTLPAIERSKAAIETLCENYQIDAKLVISTIDYCEDIDRSPTMQWFQELVLGTESYEKRYNKAGRFNTQSYLRMYDIPLISPEYSEMVQYWVGTNDIKAAIMTNRPSGGPGDYSGSPEAELGSDLLKLSRIPIIGFGEISWLAETIGAKPGALVKPNPAHALAAIISATNLDKKLSLRTSILSPDQWPHEILEKLRGGTITVFEDTPAGLVSASTAVEILRKSGIEIGINFVGIAREGTKKSALETQEAKVFEDVNAALKRIEGNGAFTKLR